MVSLYEIKRMNTVIAFIAHKNSSFKWCFDSIIKLIFLRSIRHFYYFLPEILVNKEIGTSSMNN